MSDAALREVLRSPLDDLPHRKGSAGRALSVFLLAAACGAGAVAAARALVSPLPSGTTPVTTQAAGQVPGPPALVPMGDLGAEVAAWWPQGEHLYVLVSTIVPSNAEAPAAPAVPAAHWVLRLAGGDLATATAEYTSGAVPGLVTVEFPAAEPFGAVELLAYPRIEVLEGTFLTSRAQAQLPWAEAPEGAPYRLGGEEVIVDRARVDDAGGEIVWHLAGSDPSRAIVTAGASYRELGGEAQVIVAEEGLPRAFLMAEASPLPAARSGLVRLFRLDDPEQPSFRSRWWGDPERVVPIEGFTLEIRVRVYRFADKPVVIPFGPPELG